MHSHIQISAAIYYCIHTKILLKANMHELYVEYNLNPFSSIRQKQKIDSKRFDAGVGELVDDFNETYGKKGMSWM
jgi:hypothetical protein